MDMIVTAEEMRRAEKEYFASGADSREVMYRAGAAMADYIAGIMDSSPCQTSFLAVCGSGNNAGDGFVATQILASRGYDAHVAFIGEHDRLTPDAKYYLDKCSHLLSPVFEADIILDAIFGTGFHGELSGEALLAAKQLNSFDSLVLAADIPSGAGSGFSVRAHRTLCVQAAKPLCACGSHAQNAGRLTVLDAGIPGLNPCAYLINHDDIPAFLPRKSFYGHKGSFGSVGIVGGCRGMEGAAMLSAEAASRCGAGKVTIVSSLPYYDRRPPHIMLSDSVQDFDAVAYGMGAGRSQSALRTRESLLTLPCPVVLDADALFELDADSDILLSRKERGLRTVLTPHLGEAARLLGRPAQLIDADPIAAAVEISRLYHADTVLKSWYTVTVWEDRIYVLNNPTGALATAGSGDCLAGICAAVLARAQGALPAAPLIHNAAGHAAAKSFGSGSVNALDIISCIHLD